MNPAALFPREDFVAAVFGFFDESGKFKNNNVVSFAGVVASSSKAQEFGSAWEYCLRHFGLRCLSMKNALNHKRPIGTREPGRGSANRSAALMNFAGCIRDHIELVVGIAIDVKAFSGLPSEAKRLLGNDPHFLAFTRAIHEMVKFVPGDTRISVICDDEEFFADKCLRLYRRLKMTHGETGKRLVSICFADDRAYSAIQAADMISSLLRFEAQRQIDGTPYEYQALYNFLMTSDRARYSVGIFGKEQLEGVGRDAMKTNKWLKGKAIPLA